MRKSFSLSPRRQRLVIGCLLGASLPLGLSTHVRATDIYTAAYGGTNDTGGSTPLASGTYNLNAFTITGIYTAGSTTTESLFITDGTATGRLFGTDTLFPNAAVGQVYTATVVDSVYQGTEEFKTPTNFTLQSGTGTVTTQSATIAQVANTVTTSNTSNPFTASPADSLYASEGKLLFAPVTFSITPTTSGSLSTTTTTALIDQATGNTVSLYRSATAISYTAGQTYTVTGFEQPYNGFTGQNSVLESEIVNATSLVASFAAPIPLYRQNTAGSWVPSNSTNWSTTAAGPGNTGWTNDGTITAFFQKAPTGNITINAGNINATGLEFDVSGYTIASDGVAGDTLTLQNSGLVTVTNATDTATISAPIAGSVGLNKLGAGTLVLGGVNTYTGMTTISGGTLAISADANLGNGGGVTLSGGTLQPTSGNLTLTRAVTGSGGVNIAANTTLTVAGIFNAGTVTLPSGGTLSLTGGGNTLASGADFAVTGLVFQTAGASLLTADPNTGTAQLGITNLGASGITATHASGTVSAASIFQVTGTVPISVTNAGAVLSLSGTIAGAAVLAKTGAGTLVINTDNSGLTGSGTTTPVSFRQGSAATTAAAGGIVSITATTPNPGSALGTGEFDANGGTISNMSGSAITLAISDISLGARESTATPGGLVFAGNAGITVTGPISLFKGTGTTGAAYQHEITVSTPTTFSGIFTVSATTTTSTGVTILGSSTLTLSGTAANTFTEPVTIATSGTGSGVIATKNGAFGANTGITLNAGAQLTINTGVTTGTVNAINDAALVTINGTAGSPGSFGKIVLTIGSAAETVGGLDLTTTDGKFAAGYLPAGTYGSTSSGATFQDNNLFSGTGVIMNLGTAVPEPSTWVALLVGGCGLAVVGRRGRWHRV